MGNAVKDFKLLISLMLWLRDFFVLWSEPADFRAAGTSLVGQPWLMAWASREAGLSRIREYEMSQIPVCDQLKTLQSERNLAHGSEESTEAGT